MKITEDKFLNKSAEEIVNDLLADCKDSPKDALTTIQDLLSSEDGLSFSSEVKQELQKACDMLNSKVESTGHDIYFKVVENNQKPLMYILENIDKFDNPLVEKTCFYLKNKHPKAIIDILSDLGTYSLYENSLDDYIITITLSNGKIEQYIAGTLPLAKAMAKKLKETNPEKYKNAKFKFRKKKTEDSVVTTALQNNIANNLSNVGISSLLGISPAFTKPLTNILLKSLDKKLTNDDIEDLKEDDELNLNKSAYIDSNKDIADLDERLAYSLHGIHPGLADKRKPKWHNTLNNKSNLITLPNFEDTPVETLLVLNGIEKTTDTPKGTDKVIVTEKIPVNITDSGIVYKDGKSYYITVDMFKRMINSPENANILQKFEKTHSEDPEFMLAFDMLAKENLEKAYLDWESKYYDIYDLGNYSLSERAKIYLRWKEVNKDSMYQKGRELTPEEVLKDFGIPHLINQAKELNVLKDKDLEKLKNLLTILPADKAQQVRDSFENILINNYKNDKEDLIKDLSDWSNFPIRFASENKINQITNNELINFEDLLNKKGLSKKQQKEYENDKAEFLNKYIDSRLNIPLVKGKEIEIKKDLENLKNKYLANSNNSWRDVASKIKTDYKNSVDIFNQQKDSENQDFDDWKKIINALVTTKVAGEDVPTLDLIDKKISNIRDLDTKGMPIKQKYRELFDNQLKKWKDTYDTYSPELDKEIKKFYKRLKDDLKKPSTITKSLETYL